jgi:hypothetical protein
VQWLIGSLNYLEAPLPPIPVALAITTSLGQDLFEPPNVKGWEGGAAWITTDALLKRYNYASVLVEGGESIQELMGGELQRAMRQSEQAMPEDGEMMKAQSRMSRRTFMLRRREALAISVVDADKVLPGSDRESKAQALDHLQWRLFQSALRPRDVEAFRIFFDALPPPGQWPGRHIREVVHAMMSTPQFQLT